MSRWHHPAHFQFGFNQMPMMPFFMPRGPMMGGMPYPMGGPFSMRGGMGGRGRGKRFTPYNRKPSGKPDGDSDVKVKTEPKEDVEAMDEDCEGEEEGNIDEPKTLKQILKGQNPLVYLNEQVKLRSLQMDFDLVSEFGPAHDRTYEYRLSLGDLVTVGQGRNKKESKTKAAEDMVMKMQSLPPPKVRRGGFYGRGRFTTHSRWRGKKPAATGGNIVSGAGDAKDAVGEDTPPKPACELVNPGTVNPVSRLYEYCKKMKWPDPQFDCVAEEVLEQRRVPKGFMLRKTNFTIMCKIVMKEDQSMMDDKIYYGTALTKKAAKTEAAISACIDMELFDPGTNIQELLAQHRKEAESVNGSGGSQQASSSTQQSSATSGLSQSAIAANALHKHFVPAQPQVIMHR